VNPKHVDQAQGVVMNNDPMVRASLNQQFFFGWNLAQQASALEQSANLPAAAAALDQAIAAIYGSIAQASDFGVFIPDNVHFAYATCQYNAARVKVMLGRGHEGAVHLHTALQAANNAIKLNPSQSSYHAFAGAVLICQRNYPTAQLALQEAVRLNPYDAWSNWTLATVHQWLGNQLLARQYWGKAIQVQPNLPLSPPSPPNGLSNTMTMEGIIKVATAAVGLAAAAVKLGHTIFGGASANN
jgi:tetratricopeptide (TPR) repeat protein